MLIALVWFTAALLRRFHDRTPTSPLAHPVVGSLLFAAIFVLLLISAREWRRGAVPGRGIRLGSLTPLMLILLVEKWASIGLYPIVFHALPGSTGPPGLVDARFRLLAGVGLVAVCVLVAGLSRPTARRCRFRCRVGAWIPGALATAAVVAGCYGLLAAAAIGFGVPATFQWPRPSTWLWTVLCGQALLAFGEELYYRGLILGEAERLAPRLGIRAAGARRWFALSFSAALFGIEHMEIGPPWDDTLRRLVFTVALGILFGMLVTISENLHFAAGVHAWINWLLLGAAPRFVGPDGRPLLPPGTYIGLALVFAFVLAFWMHRQAHRTRRAQRESLDSRA